MLRIATALTILISASVSLGAQTIVWQIGKPDGSYAEFALAGKYEAYGARFAEKPPVFEVGKSDPARDWPFIHPGPADSWAGAREHPFRIRFNFDAEPRGTYLLRIEFVDVHGGAPPLYLVTIGGRTGKFRLQPGNSAESLTNPKAGKPQKLELSIPARFLHKGANEITLTSTDGSWLLYDALTMLNDPQARAVEPSVQNVTAAATPFFIRADGKLRRVIDVTVGLTGGVTSLTIRTEAGGETTEVTVSPKELPEFGGSVTTEVGVPDAAEPLEVKVTATTAGKSKSTTLSVPPVRKWRVFVGASAHTDIGYTDIPPHCAEVHNKNFETAAELCAKYPGFKWNAESAWQAENFLASRKGERRETFLRLAREGRIGIQALYANILTGLCSAEEICRFTYFAHSLKTRYGIPFRSAMITDVPSQEWSLPMILANSGIRYFSTGMNGFRGASAPEFYAKVLCWWEGPDGSRVLTWRIGGYGYAEGWGLDSTFRRAREVLPGVLNRYAADKDYPYDALFAHGAVVDNRGINPGLATVAEEWNRRYEFPKIILCHNAEFFEYVEQKFRDQIPVLRGSGGGFWEDGAGSSAQETALNRNAHETLASGEALWALAQRVRPAAAYPRQALYDAWRHCLLFDEHTWGAGNSIGDPDGEMTKAQWKFKAQHAYDADRQSRALRQGGARAMASLVRTDGRSLVVMNPSSWPRTEVVSVSLPEGTAVADEATACRYDGGTLLLVKDVPACGYRVLPLQAAQGAGSVPAAEAADGSTIESRFYRVTFDPATGAITSLFDKELNRELVEAGAPQHLNQYLYVAGEADGMVEPRHPKPVPTVISSPTRAVLKRQRLGRLGEVMTVETSAVMTPKLTSRVFVWNDLKRVDIDNRLTKTPTYNVEAVYFAFPFAAHKPTFRYECPAGVVNPSRDMIPGACLCWFAVQHFVEIEDADGAIAWATPDAPLASFQHLHHRAWPMQLPMTNGRVYSYMMNNYWNTNYKAGQGGEFQFRYAITNRPKSDRAASERFGAAVSAPLVVTPVEANPNGPLPAGSASLVAVDEPNVVVVGIKQAEEGQGLVVRLWETQGKATTAHLRLGHVPATKATACNLVEDRGPGLEIKGGTVAVPIRGSGLATVLLE